MISGVQRVKLFHNLKISFNSNSNIEQIEDMGKESLASESICTVKLQTNNVRFSLVHPCAHSQCEVFRGSLRTRRSASLLAFRRDARSSHACPLGSQGPRKRGATGAAPQCRNGPCMQLVCSQAVEFYIQ